MTPIEFARNLARGDEQDQVLAVALLARGLSDDDPATLRQGWPLKESVKVAAEYLKLEPTPALLAAAIVLAPTISDAMLNRVPHNFTSFAGRDNLLVVTDERQ